MRSFNSLSSSKMKIPVWLLPFHHRRFGSLAYEISPQWLRFFRFRFCVCFGGMRVDGRLKWLWVAKDFSIADVTVGRNIVAYANKRTSKQASEQTIRKKRRLSERSNDKKRRNTYTVTNMHRGIEHSSASFCGFYQRRFRVYFMVLLLIFGTRSHFLRNLYYKNAS